jgi:hypothetical protein
MTSIRVWLTILCALTLSLAFALPVTAQPPCAVCGDSNTAVGSNALPVNTGNSNKSAPTKRGGARPRPRRVITSARPLKQP